jgi:hypothetical protein
MPINPGGLLNSVPAPQKQTLSTNYIDFTSSTTLGWAQQYLPDLMEAEAEVFGPRTISGFLSQVSAEEPMTSDQVIWSEQGRLHLSYKGHIQSTAGGASSGGQIEIEGDIDGTETNATGPAFAPANHGIRVGDTLIIANSEGVVKARVETVANAIIDVTPYGVADLSSAFTTVGGTKDTTILVYGSEFKKGDDYQGSAARTANEPDFKTFTNKPIILKDYYEISGSDAAQVGWVEVSGEEGQNGYLWYLKAEGDTRARFADYLEMAMMEAELGVPGTDFVDNSMGLPGTDVGATGTQGLFDAINDRGNVTTGITGVNPSTDFAEFDLILAEFDKQGAIEENMLFVNRNVSLAIDDMLASVNRSSNTGSSYGVFNNSESMALNLGFEGFRRGSYDFYKSDFRYLNDKATRGSINDANSSEAIRGVIIPAGVSTVYDQTLGRNLKRPFLHVRYRASQMEDRRMKTFVTGSVGGNITSSLDAMQIHFLSERCLITQGANNFMLMK